MIQSLETQKEQLVAQIRKMEGEQEQREKYIVGIERQIRQLKDDSDRVKTDSQQNDQQTYKKVRELERDM